MSEMTALEYLKEKARMTKAVKYGSCNTPCGDCSLSRENSGKNILCVDFEMLYPEEAISAVQEWAEKHPVKTMLQDFFEKYPKAKRKKSGEPAICPETLGYRPEGTGCHVECYDCWNRPLEE